MKTFFSFAFLLISILSFAQTAPPEGINYQAVARDTAGKPISSSLNLVVRFTIWPNSGGTGAPVFTETHSNVHTNIYGLFTLVIGSVENADFAAINWTSGVKYLEVEIATVGGSGYTSMGVNQMMSVPYALYAKSSGDKSWYLSGNTFTDTSFIGTTNAKDFVVKTNSTERLRVKSAGNVGIGTSSPDPLAKLDVAGRVKITGGNPAFNKVLTSDALGLATWTFSVDSFSAGDLPLLFTTTVTNSTTTPTLSFDFSPAPQYTVFGNNAGTSNAPIFFIPTLASSLFRNQGTTTQVLHGDASGNPSWGLVKLNNPNQEVSGILPIANGGTSSSAVGVPGSVAYSTNSIGAYGFTTSGGNSGQVLTSPGGGGTPTWATPTTATVTNVSGIPPISVTNPTTTPVITVALNALNSSGVLPPGTGNADRVWQTDNGGTPSWGQVNLTAQVANILPLANGGSSASLTAVNGGIVWSNATKMQISLAGAPGDVLTSSGAGAPTWQTPTTGTVTSFSAGDLTPLFTTTEATVTTTPALSFTLTPAGARTILGNNTGSSAAPSYISPTLAGSLFQGQGNTTEVLHGNSAGNLSWTQIVNADITNGTINLATKVTGILPIANGGTNIGTIGVAGTVTYSNGTQHVSTAVGIGGQVLTSAGAGSPAWVNASTIMPAVGNGLNIGSGPTQVELGGTLIHATAVNQAGFALALGGGTGAISINASSGVATTNIGTGTTSGTVTIGGDGTQTIGIGNNAAGAKTITIGNTIATTSVSLPRLTSAGIVTNTAAGVIGTTAIVPIANGGTGTTTAPTTGGIIWGVSGTVYGSTAAGSAGQVFTSTGGGTPVFTTGGSVGQVLTHQGGSTPTWTSVSTGTVISVGLALPSIFTVTNSPVTTAGTLTGTLATQAANLVFAGPGSGGAAAPTFRALVTSDLPGGTAFFADPTASPGIGLTAINGSATTAMRSDAAPALDVSIIPTWTGTHTFSSTSTYSALFTGGNVGIGFATPTAKLYVRATTTGIAGIFENTTAANSSSALIGRTNGSGSAIFGTNTGTVGIAGNFAVNNILNTSDALVVTTNGGGKVGSFTNTSATNTSDALVVTTNGGGKVGSFTNTSATNTSDALVVTTNGNNAKGINVSSTGGGTTNVGGYFTATGATNNYAAIFDQGSVGMGTTTTATNARLAIKDGHLQSQQTTLITSIVSVNTSAQSLTNATDIAGNISFTPSSVFSAGSVQFTFSLPYTIAPIVIITPTNADAATDIVKVFVTPTLGTITINFGGGCLLTAHTYSYHVIETQ